MPSGWDNNCEDEYPISPWKEEHKKELNATYTLKTKPEVLHAETNAIAKLAKSTESGANATLFVTHAPCLDCAKLVYQSGINNVFYRNSYRSDDGIRFLEKAGVQVTQV
jgi:dCMP deaminase